MAVGRAGCLILLFSATFDALAAVTASPSVELFLKLSLRLNSVVGTATGPR